MHDVVWKFNGTVNIALKDTDIEQRMDIAMHALYVPRHAARDFTD